ncbi:hypothetical protein HPB50_002929 [Hyalomma asiaticum]|uniref:Uncharacterized protein n=1 Tax=Hyalomma asiaticum TaxID=266040 RepID=A0ACB7RWI6_HYAAI|nr:hypothetical protein HPB50_002929 [Hyalomma asiaticum]
MHCLAERSKIGQTVTGKPANAMRASNSIAAAIARPNFFRFISRETHAPNLRTATWIGARGGPPRAPIQVAVTCGKQFQRATPRAFVWFAARPENSEETRASLSPRFPPCATEPSDEIYVAPSDVPTPAHPVGTAALVSLTNPFAFCWWCCWRVNKTVSVSVNCGMDV